MRVSTSLYFQCIDVALAIFAGSIGVVIAQDFGYAACFLFAGLVTLLVALLVLRLSVSRAAD